MEKPPSSYLIRRYIQNVDIFSRKINKYCERLWVQKHGRSESEKSLPTSVLERVGAHSLGWSEGADVREMYESARNTEIAMCLSQTRCRK